MADDVQRRGDGRGKGVDPRLIGGLVILVLLVVFVLQNRESTPLTFLFFDFSAPLWVMLAGTVVLSLLVGYIAGHRAARAKR
jgi:uncharacterized integral membrane protein